MKITMTELGKRIYIDYNFKPERTIQIINYLYILQNIFSLGSIGIEKITVL